MIQIYYTDAGGELRVDMKGHGELENIQQLDVMCAATTVLANTLGINAYSAEQLGMLEEPAIVYIGDDGEGKARILAKPKAEYYSTVKTMFVIFTQQPQKKAEHREKKDGKCDQQAENCTPF